MQIVLCKYIFVDIPENALDTRHPASLEVSLMGVALGEFFPPEELDSEVLKELEEKYGKFDEIYRPL